MSTTAWRVTVRRGDIDTVYLVAAADRSVAIHEVRESLAQTSSSDSYSAIPCSHGVIAKLYSFNVNTGDLLV